MTEPSLSREAPIESNGAHASSGDAATTPDRDQPQNHSPDSNQPVHTSASQEPNDPQPDKAAPRGAANASPVRPSWVQTRCRIAFLDRLSRIERGQLIVDEPTVQTRVGRVAADEVIAQIQVNHPAFFSAVAFGGAMGAAESFMDGHWQSDRLVDTLRLMDRNQHVLTAVEGKRSWRQQVANRWLQKGRANSLAGSRRNIAAHYDLGNEFFRLILDPTMTYSCGVFPKLGATMEEASLEKYRLVAQKLRLSPDDHVLEIGTGWGGFAIYAATDLGCRVTTTTISAAQHEMAKQRIEAAGLSDRVTLLKQDYRELRGIFDKLVSIEMIEAVGHDYLPTYLDKCGSLLKPDGLMLLQAITIPHARYERYRRSVDFIQKYIFPGGCLPSIPMMLQAASSRTDMELVHQEDFGKHYVCTLEHWKQRLFEQREAIAELGKDETFQRCWHYYFAYCQAGFAERRIGLSQLLFAKPQARGLHPSDCFRHAAAEAEFDAWLPASPAHDGTDQV